MRKKSEITKPRLIKNEDEVDRIIAEAATSRPSRRTMNRQNVAPDDSDCDEDNHSAFLSPA